MISYTFIFHIYHFQETISYKLDMRFCLPLMIRYFFGYQYSVLIKMAQEKFKMLNMEITKFIKISEKVKLIVAEDYPENKKQLKKIKYCMKIYHKAANIIRTYNTIFAPQLIVTYSTLFIDIISDLVCAYDDIKANYSLASAVVWTNWLTLYTIQILVMTLTCYKTNKAAETTGQIINQLMGECNLHASTKNRVGRSMHDNYPMNICIYFSLWYLSDKSSMKMSSVHHLICSLLIQVYFFQLQGTQLHTYLPYFNTKKT
ncbi:unnamed protein product [Callosobruchus maculatus]|uniref:Uncharacterized protein n=1 Tax=Callosobruchus maculatus TaxID=64391 RepID=A0A653DG85_CALMS|nr:unnamed protein product [Callosobruchus maculatus]